MADRWYYNVGGERFGPIDDAALAALAKAGTVERHTPLQKVGSTDWQPAAQVPGLFREIKPEDFGEVSPDAPTEDMKAIPAGSSSTLVWSLVAGAVALGASVGVYFAMQPGGSPIGDADSAYKSENDEPGKTDRPAPPLIARSKTDGEKTPDPLEKTPPRDPLIDLLPKKTEDEPKTKVEEKAKLPEKTVEIAKVEPVLPKPEVKTEPKTKTEPAPKTKTPEPPPPKPKTPAELTAEAEALFADVFGPFEQTAAKATPVKKVEFARKLARSAVTAADSPELVRLIRLSAAGFAEADPSGYELAIAMLRELPPEAAVAGRLAAVLEKRAKHEKAASGSLAGLEYTAACVDWAEEALKARRIDDAVEAIAKAKKAARQYAPGKKKLFAEIDEYEKHVAARRQALARQEAALKAAAENPDDPAANLAAALHLLTCEDKLDAAAARLLKAADPAHRVLGEALQRKDAKPLEVADAFRAAAAATAGKEEKAVLTAHAAARYRAVLEAEPAHPDAVRIKLLAQAPRDEPAAAAVKPKVEMPEAKPEPAATATPATPLTLTECAGMYGVRRPSGLPLMTVMLYANGQGNTEGGVNRNFFTWMVKDNSIVIQFVGAAEAFTYKSAGVYVGKSGQVMTKAP